MGNLNQERQEQATLKKELQQQIGIMNQERGKRRRFLDDIHQQESLQQAALESLQLAASSLDQTIASLYVEPPERQVGKTSGHFYGLKGSLKMPVSGKIIAKFGKYKNNQLNIENFRSGIDISATRGDPIHSVCRGKVLFASWFKGYGNMIIIDHGDQYYTVYAHAQEMFKKRDEQVAVDEVIATVGDTASMKGPALYFEIRYQGIPIDPRQWLQADAFAKSLISQFE